MSFRLGAITALVLMAAPAAAQTTRVEAIAQEQAKKARALAPEGPNTAEQVVVRVMSSPLLSGGGGAYPWFGSVFGGSGFAVGGGYLKRLPWDASANAMVGFSINNSKLLEAQFQLPELWRGRLRVDGAARWTDAKDVSYFGVGADSQLDDRDPYDYQPTELDTTVTLRPAPWAYASAGYTRLDIQAEDADGDAVAPLAAPGVGADLGYHVTRVTAAIDWRSSPGYATRGGLYRVSWDRYDESTGQPYAFSSTEYEVRQLVPLVREQFVLAVRGLVTTTQADAGQGVPVMLAPYLGSGSTLRGFGNRRFTDRHRALLQGEYRWRPSRYMDMALFVDAGQVAAETRQFRLGDFETSYGIGLRVHGPRITAFRVELAKSREGWKSVFAGTQTF